MGKKGLVARPAQPSGESVPKVDSFVAGTPLVFLNKNPKKVANPWKTSTKETSSNCDAALVRFRYCTVYTSTSPTPVVFPSPRTMAV